MTLTTVGSPVSCPWAVISDYPAWPSPYFAELQRHAPARLQLEFIPGLESIATWTGPVGVLNLHRLKRLYRESDGTRTVRAAQEMLATLTALRAAGWRLVWTVHNLLPIDGGPPTAADRHAARGVLDLADAVITHTRADANHLAALTTAPITVAGWAGLSAPALAAPAPSQVTALARRIREAPHSVLVLGNLTAYKDLATIVTTFASSTRVAQLFIVGPCRDDALVADLTAAIGRTHMSEYGEGRVHLYPYRIDPEQVHLLYAEADAALCPYRIDGPWEFFTRVLHPSSVATAVSFGVPVIAPELPAVIEITTGHPRWLYAPQRQAGHAFEAFENGPRPTAQRVLMEGADRWRSITAAYVRLAADLLSYRTGRA